MSGTVFEYTDEAVEQIRKGQEPTSDEGIGQATTETKPVTEPAKDEQSLASKQEIQAQAEGWTNLDEWTAQGKSANDWVDAPEFNRRGELMTRIKGQTKALKSTKGRIEELENAIKVLGDHNKQIAKVEFERAKRALTAKKIEAMDDRDHETVLEIDEKLNELTDKAKAAEEEVLIEAKEEEKQELGQPPAQVISWIERPDNTWYKEDAAMRAAADALATEYGKQNFDPAIAPEDQPWDGMLQYVEDELHSRFPGYFQSEEDTGTTKPVNKRKVASVAEPGAGGQRANRGKKTGLRISDLSDEEKAAHDEFVLRSKIMTTEEYLNQLEAVRSA